MMETETGMCLQVKGCQPGTAGKPPEAERGKEGVSLGVSRKTRPLNFRPLAPQNWGRTHLCCFKPPELCPSVMAGLGKEPSTRRFRC